MYAVALGGGGVWLWDAGGGSDPQSALFAAIAARKEKQEARMRAIEAGEIEVEDPREKRLQELKKQKAAEAAAKKKSAEAAAAKK